MMHPSEKWIRDYAAELGINFDWLMEEADNQVRTGDGRLVGGAELEGVGVSREFWRHYAALKPEEIIPDDPGDFFGCSC